MEALAPRSSATAATDPGANEQASSYLAPELISDLEFGNKV